MTEHCNECQAELAEGQGHRVAHWTLCGECLDRLMHRGEDEGPSPEEETGVCVICDAVVPREDTSLLLGLMFCRACYQRLVLRTEGAPCRASQDTEPGFRVAQEFVATGRSTACSGCGRCIPLAGAKERDGEPLCPECYYGHTTGGS